MDETDINTYVVLVMGFVERKSDGKFLMGLRDSDDPQAGGEWELLGGKVEVLNGDVAKDELLEFTIKTELLQEAGVIVDEFTYLHSWSFKRASGHIVVGILFHCFLQEGEAEALEGHKEVGWFTIEEMLEKNSKPYFKTFLEKLKNRRIN